MDYPVKTPHQLRPLLVGFRKAAGLTQAQVATRLGITQQTYAQLEAKPESASMERLFHILKMLEVSLVLTHASSPAVPEGSTSEHAQTVGSPVASQPGVATKRGGGTQAKPATGAATRKREDW